MTDTKLAKERKLSFFEFIQTLKWLFVFNFKISPWATITQILFKIIYDLSPLLNALIFAKLIDKLVKIVASTNSNLNDIIPLLSLLFLFNIFISALNSINSYASTIVQVKLNNRAHMILADHINKLGIQTLENPEVVNKIERSRNLIGSFTNDLNSMTMFISKIIVLVSTSIIVLKIMPVIAIIICLAIIPELISNRIHMKKDWEIWRKATEGRRKANSSVTTLIETISLQEITITSSFGMLKNIFDNFMNKYIQDQVDNSKSWQTWGFFLGSITDITSIFGYFSIFKNYFYKMISLGDVTFQMKTLDMFVSNITTVSNVFSNLYERAIKINEVKIVFEMSPMIQDGNIIIPKFEKTPSIKYENVSFKYPGSDRMVIKNLNLDIKSGEKIAIVGENGAGKTTLIKLLSRFYKVSEGDIFINDYNLSHIKIESWYKNLGVLFQEFNRYPYLSLKENVHIGEPDEIIDMNKIETAAKQANVNSFVGDYKNGYNQILSEGFKGGTRPSTGQWQKIAIARFFYRNSPVVVFDEPTASIDAVSEAEIFGKIYEFFTGKTVIIISHRFSTVRNADKIYVLDKGEIVESGNHTELMKLKGKYYTAFNIQAKGYHK